MNQDLYLAYITAIPTIGRKSVLKILAYLSSKQISIEQSIQEKVLLSPESPLSEKQKDNYISFATAYTVTSFNEMLQKSGIRLVSQSSKEYPALLYEIEDKPVMLFTKGAPYDQSKIPIAVVGSRKMTAYGKAATEFFVKDAKEYNCSIISGCMYGVDMCAHQIAIKEVVPTVGILGFGFKHIYPHYFKDTLEELLKNGATLMTEFAPQVSALPGNFPVRNRIVAGISQATVVVEAGLGSGSLITAECAINYNRTVAAIPGPFNSQYSEGTKWLINQGAKLVTSAKDVIEDIYNITIPTTTSSHEAKKAIQWDSALEKEIYTLLIIEKDIDDLASELKHTIVELQVAITTLEMKGLIIKRGNVLSRK